VPPRHLLVNVAPKRRPPHRQSPRVPERARQNEAPLPSHCGLLFSRPRLFVDADPAVPFPLFVRGARGRRLRRPMQCALLCPRGPARPLRIGSGGRRVAPAPADAAGRMRPSVPELPSRHGVTRSSPPRIYLVTFPVVLEAIRLCGGLHVAPAHQNFPGPWMPSARHTKALLWGLRGVLSAAGAGIFRLRAMPPPLNKQ